MPKPSSPPAISLGRCGGFVAIRAVMGTVVVLAVWCLIGSRAEAQRVLVPEREWSDATGMFKVQASLVGIEGTALTLRQTDGSDLTIELDQLAPLDQLVARRTMRRLAHRGEGPPHVEAFDHAARATNHTDFPPLAHEPLVADPADAGRGIVAGKVKITRRDPFDRVGRVLAVGGAGAVVLVAIENSTPGRPLPTRRVWLSMKSQTVIAEHDLSGPEIVLDYHPILERLLTVSREKVTAEGAAKQVLTLWDAAASRKAATAWSAWRAPCGDGQPLARHPWGRIVNDALVVHQSSREEFSCWDIDAKRALYRLAQDPGHSPMPSLSGGGRYLALPDTRRVQVCDAATGTVLVSLSVGATSGVSFDSEGRRLALIQEGNVQIHDLADPTGPIPVLHAQGASPQHTALAWVGEEQLLIQSARGLAAVLWSAVKGLPAWRYEWQPVQSGDTVDDLAVRVVQGMLLYAAPPDDGEDADAGEGKKKPGTTLAVIVAAKIPEPVVAKVTVELPAGLPALVEPGTVVATKVDFGADHDREIAAVAKTFERTKWLYDANSPAQVEVSTTAGGTVTYTDAEGRERQLKQVTPTTRQIRVVVHGVPLVAAKRSTDIPDKLVLGAGETDKDLAARLPTPDLAWIERILFPSALVDVTEADGLGTTTCTAAGLTTKRAK
jgi:hypothetical protein